ncbi:MAG: hypothetical protein ACRCYR_03675 [Phycicoccus sp.]
MEETARAEVAVVAATRDLADYALGVAGEVTTSRPHTARIHDARKLRVLALTVLDRTVILEVLAGASWEDIARALMLPLEVTVQRYSPVVEKWRAGAPAGQVDASVYGDLTTGLPADHDPEGTAESLDAWIDRHLEPWQDRGPRLRARL